MLFINQYTGPLFSDVIDTLRGVPGPHFLVAGEAARRWPNVRWLKCARLKKRGHLGRIISWLRFSACAFLHVCRYGRGQHLLFVTNPPIALWMAPLARKILGCQYSVLVYDLYPDALFAIGLVSDRSVTAKVWRRLNARAFRSATHVIALGHGMARAIADQLAPNSSLDVQIIASWADDEFFRPVAKRENPIVAELGLTDQFIVGYAGSFGAVHGLETILDCAARLQEHDKIHFLLVGGGTEERRLREHLDKRPLENVTWLPTQPAERFRWIAPAFDLSLVLLRRGAGDAVFPSKLYTALAAGTATLAAADASSDLARIVSEYQCGVVVPPGDSQAMASSILALAEDRQRLEAYKRNARERALSRHTREVQCQRYAALFSG